MEINLHYTREELPDSEKQVVYISFGEVFVGYYEPIYNAFETDEGYSTEKEAVQTWIYAKDLGYAAHEAFKAWYKAKYMKPRENAPLKWIYHVIFGYSNGHPFDDAYFSTLEKAKQFEQELRDEDDADADDTVQTYIERIPYIEGMELDDED